MPEFTDLHAAIQAYEARQDPEAVFVNEVDKLIPLVTNYLQSGYSWKKTQMPSEKLFANKRENIQNYTEIKGLLEQFISEMEARRSDFFNQ